MLKGNHSTKYFKPVNLGLFSHLRKTVTFCGTQDKLFKDWKENWIGVIATESEEKVEIFVLKYMATLKAKEEINN